MKTFTFFIIIMLMVNLNVSAQGFKDILEKLETLEKSLDNLEAKQEKETQNLQKQLTVIKPQQSATGEKNFLRPLEIQIGDMKSEITTVAAGVNELTKEVEQLKGDVKQASEVKVSQETMNELQEVITRLNTRIGMLSEPKNDPPIVEQKAVEDKPKLICKPYGYVKLDMAYDQARSNNGNYVFWIEPPASSDKKDSEFNMTPRQTRLGLDLHYEGLKGRNVSARFEMDFYGGGTENKTMLMMRHGYLKVDFGKYYLLAGQTSDIFSPLVPTTVNYIVLWNCGNIGYRSPQIQFGNKVTEGIEIVGAVSRNLPGDVDNDGNDDGEDSSLPAVQARASYINPKINTGISGHYGIMDYTDSNGKDDKYSSYSINYHISYSFSSMFSIRGEVFTGKTLSQYFGGIGQGFNYKLGKEVETSGGWVNAAFKTSTNTSYNLGCGIDQPKKDDALAFPARNQNMCVFGNVFTKIAYNTTVALEVSHWTTGYYDTSGKDTEISSLRLQGALIFNY